MKKHLSFAILLLLFTSCGNNEEAINTSSADFFYTTYTPTKTVAASRSIYGINASTGKTFKVASDVNDYSLLLQFTPNDDGAEFSIKALIFTSNGKLYSLPPSNVQKITEIPISDIKSIIKIFPLTEQSPGYLEADLIDGNKTIIDLSSNKAIATGNFSIVADVLNLDSLLREGFIVKREENLEACELPTFKCETMLSNVKDVYFSGRDLQTGNVFLTVQLNNGTYNLYEFSEAEGNLNLLYSSEEQMHPTFSNGGFLISTYNATAGTKIWKWIDTNGTVETLKTTKLPTSSYSEHHLSKDFVVSVGTENGTSLEVYPYDGDNFTITNATLIDLSSKYLIYQKDGKVVFLNKDTEEETTFNGTVPSFWGIVTSGILRKTMKFSNDESELTSMAKEIVAYTKQPNDEIEIKALDLDTLKENPFGTIKGDSLLVTFGVEGSRYYEGEITYNNQTDIIIIDSQTGTIKNVTNTPDINESMESIYESVLFNTIR